MLKKPEHKFITIMAFRGSGKSTIMNMGAALWSILGAPQKQFVIIVSQTQEQAKNHFMNIKEELKTNELLREDFGPFADDEAEWKKMSLELIYHEAKIVSVSLEQSIRGIKYGMIRPDLIICDDIEDTGTAKDDIARASAWQKLTSEVLPLGSQGTRIIVLGNLVCPDSLLMRLKKKIDEGYLEGVFRAYPLLDDERRILWPDRFPDLESVQRMKNRFTGGVWAREFLLKILGWNHGMDSDDIHAHIEESDRYITKEKIIYQKAFTRWMEPYAISVPIDREPNGFSTDDDATYQRYYGNVDINEPRRSAKEELDFLTHLAKFFDKKYKEKLRKSITGNSDEKVSREEWGVLLAEETKKYWASRISKASSKVDPLIKTPSDDGQDS